MKNALPALGLGLLLFAGSTASADGRIDLSGYYRLFFGNAWNNNLAGSRDRTSDSGMHNRLELNWVFRPTDEVSVFWRLRAPFAQRWGNDGERPTAYWAERLGTTAMTDFVYGRVTGDWGALYLGRLALNFGYTGLANLGWFPTGPDNNYTLFQPFALWNNSVDGLRWEIRRDDGAKLLVQFNRLETVQTFGNTGDEDSADLLWVEGGKTWTGGGASLGAILVRDRATAHGAPTAGDSTRAFKAFFLNPAVSQSWGDFGLHFEGKAGRGRDYASGLRHDGYAFYLDLDYNYGPGNLNLAGWWASGGGQDGRRHDLVGLGRAFGPLVVAYGDNLLPHIRGATAVAIANANSGAAGNRPGFATSPSRNDVSNHRVLDLNGNHSLTGDFRLTWALAYLALNKVREGASRSIGFETDLGFQFKLLDNLEWRSTFGYLFAGRAFDGYGGSPSPRGAGYSAADACSWYNTLTFNF